MTSNRSESVRLCACVYENVHIHVHMHVCACACVSVCIRRPEVNIVCLPFLLSDMTHVYGHPKARGQNMAAITGMFCHARVHAMNAGC